MLRAFWNVTGNYSFAGAGQISRTPSNGNFRAASLSLENRLQSALVRELREELGIEATAGAELMRYEFAYPGKQTILLIFLEAPDWRGEIENRIFETLAWERLDALSRYDFLEGDAPFLKAITAPEWKTERRLPGSGSL